MSKYMSIILILILFLVSSCSDDSQKITTKTTTTKDGVGFEAVSVKCEKHIDHQSNNIRVGPISASLDIKNIDFEVGVDGIEKYKTLLRHVSEELDLRDLEQFKQCQQMMLASTKEQENEYMDLITAKKIRMKKLAIAMKSADNPDEFLMLAEILGYNVSEFKSKSNTNSRTLNLR